MKTRRNNRNSEAGGESNEGMDDVEYEPEEEENEPQSPTGKGWVIQIVGQSFSQ